jgi:hypothetical protein
MNDTFAEWESVASEAPIADASSVEEIDPFDARGLRLVYGRRDHFGRHHSFNMDIWSTRDGRLLMRCWSQCADIDGRCFEIKGVNVAAIPRRDAKLGFQDSWIPQAVRRAYDTWIGEEY